MVAGYDLIIRNGVVVTDAEVQELDIAVKDGKIARIVHRGGLSVASATKVIDAEGGYVMVGPFLLTSFVVVLRRTAWWCRCARASSRASFVR